MSDSLFRVLVEALTVPYEDLMDWLDKLENMDEDLHLEVHYWKYAQACRMRGIAP